MPYNHPVGWTSEEYLAAPVTLAGPSIRSVPWPITFRFSGQLRITDDLRLVRDRHAGHFQGGGQHAALRAATAKIPGTGRTNFVRAGVWVLLQECRHSHHETGRAVTAHQSVALDKRLLHNGEFAAF